MMRKVLNIVAVLIFLCGFGLLLYPRVENVVGEYEQHEQIQQFNTEDKDYGPLYDEMLAYNQRIYEEGQSGLKDAFSYETNAFDTSAYFDNSNMIGYITIDKMNIEVPLYIGASFEHLSKNAAILGQTSMPIGGINTNSVIAAHRGRYTSGLFRDIENLEIGDEIRITNPWETLTYNVVKMIVIMPDDIDAIKIVEGADMVTLITCHPFPIDDQRYVVYAQRSGSEVVDVPYDGIPYTSSKQTIQQENMVNTIGLYFCGIACCLLFVVFIRNKKKNESK